MGFDLSRLRGGEWIAGASAVLLLACEFLLKWYGPLNGWHELTHLRWLVLLTVVAALALVYFEATRRAPAIPATLSVMVTVLGGLNALALIYRVLINPPGRATLSVEAGAFLGLLSALALAYGGYRSMRTEGIAERDQVQAIETVRLGSEDEPLQDAVSLGHENGS